MENSIMAQLFSLLIFTISGMIIGVLFDIFRILRKSFHTPDFVTYIEDLIFWLLTGCFLLFLLFCVGNGEIRIYMVLGLLIGCIFYLVFISKFFIKISVPIVVFIKNVIYKLIKIILFPITILGKVIRKIIKPISFFVINLKKRTHNSKKKEKNIARKKDFKEKCRKI